MALRPRCYVAICPILSTPYATDPSCLCASVADYMRFLYTRFTQVAKVSNSRVEICPIPPAQVSTAN